MAELLKLATAANRANWTARLNSVFSCGQEFLDFAKVSPGSDISGFYFGFFARKKTIDKDDALIEFGNSFALKREVDAFRGDDLAFHNATIISYWLSTT